MIKTITSVLLLATIVLAQTKFDESLEPQSCRDLPARENDRGEAVKGAAQCGEDESYEQRKPQAAEDAVGENKEGGGNEGDDATAVIGAQALEVSPAQNGMELLQNDGKLSGLCRNLNNLAPIAFPSGSGGGVGTYGPSNMNDEDQCQFYWPAGNSATIQYRWRQAQSIDHFVIVTDRSCQAGSVCAHTNAGRGIGRGTVQYWTGSSWVTDGSFTNTGTTITYRFRSCVSTTAIRVVNLATHNCGQQSNPVVYEWSVCECEEEDLRLCGNSTNLAPFATPTGTSGGLDVYGYGPSEMNDLDKCQWYWPGGNNAFINYKWDTPVYVGRFVILTDPACAVNPMCASFPNVGRGVADGTVMYLDSSNTWVVDGSFRSREGRIEYELRTCVEITQLRITGISTHNCGQQSNPVIYEWSACCCEPNDGCCN